VRVWRPSLVARVAALAADLQECEQAVALHSQQLTDALVEIGRQAEKRAAAEQSLRELKARITQLAHEREAAEQEAALAAERIAALEQEVAAARRQHAERTEECGAAQAALAELRSQRQAIRAELDACSDAVRSLHNEVEQLQQALHAAEASEREAAVRQENLITRVREELGLDLVELYGQYAHAEQDWDAIRGEIEELRGKIQRLGNVNLDAIQELEELTPRYDSMVAQRADLNDSIAKLTELIAELDAESHKRFAEAFAEIRTNFQDLFRRLFGGGRADVILEDPDRPLECGIEVIARPPGKEPQSISLLSGGEKTMTCVALLMAVFKSKPSPFAILDEVDAALDEANVERFSKLLGDFLSVSQFVVITHNKKTMAAADVLYGVTMEEPGVSKRVSVRFDDRVHTPIVA
jgi:chromosome segregation protein